MADDAAETGNDSDDSAEAEAPPESNDSDSADAATPSESEGLDLDAERDRLDKVEDKIEEGRRALADAEDEPETDGPPVAAGEGAANAPPG